MATIISFLFLVAVSGILGFLLIWILATMNILFGFIEEGCGVIVKSGESYSDTIISFNEHHMGIVERNGHERMEVVKNKPGESYAPEGVLGFLQEKFGIFYLGTLPPFRSILQYKFRWNEWKNTKDDEGEYKDERVLRHREELTEFFYVKTTTYALTLKGAETGSKIKSGETSAVGGNVEVDLHIALLINMVCPKVAIIDREWFAQLGTLILSQSLLFVGERTFEELRSQKINKVPESGSGEQNDFCEYIMKFNKRAPIGEEADGITDYLGIEIKGAYILEVELAGESKKIADETTAIYVAEQRGKATKINEDAKAYGIRAEGIAKAEMAQKMAEAEARGLEAGITTMKNHGDDGKYFVHQQALAKAGQAGSAVVFTHGNEDHKLTSNEFAAMFLSQQAKGMRGKS
ncbi:hypothetical protein AUJ77_01425 [Candidatus Nomurabacteria bacterium CG1_02_43_90]|uniref:Band 7 domain-containing protein n=1 Tax=Candidatus Nomurabacteria bacterium CG1_02_43_90 TaxID=1805281 RepID=A0A1J4V4G5_9BACT|nr:MAG: hypothetical protein AUJ77_01425 [Candidatus Nomurabacteria bacterium CG1_02_43_90]